MLRIKCVNTKCTGSTKSFEWEESRRLESGGGIAAPYAEGAVRLIVTCPHCMTDNVVWVTKLKFNFDVIRDMTIG